MVLCIIASELVKKFGFEKGKLENCKIYIDSNLKIQLNSAISNDILLIEESYTWNLYERFFIIRMFMDNEEKLYSRTFKILDDDIHYMKNEIDKLILKFFKESKNTPSVIKKIMRSDKINELLNE